MKQRVNSSSFTLRLIRASFALHCLCAAQAAWCAPEIGFSGNSSITSDYRFRGVSLSGGRPALQGWLEAHAGPSDIVVGVWTSRTLSRDRGTDEIDLYIGHGGQFRDFQYRLTAYVYLDGNLDRLQYAELQAGIVRGFGPVAMELQLAASPRQNDVPANIYASVTASLPLDRHHLGLMAHAGWEDGIYSNKIDWAVGVDHFRGPVTLSASFIGSTRRNAGDGRRARGQKCGALLAVSLDF